MKCVYCAEEEATEVIMNPNIDEKQATWDVCEDCKDVIHHQMGLSLGCCLGESKNEHLRELGEKIISKSNKELEKIAEKTKKPILNAMVYKKKDGNYDTASVVFTGE